MEESTTQQQPKQPSPAKRFFKGAGLLIKCLWILLLATLLIAGLYFQAPLKVLILLAIFLAATTVLPKRHRKYFRLTVTCVLIALAVWVFLPEDDSDWKPYTFDEEFAAIQKKYTVPDTDNAALAYEELLKKYADQKFNPLDWVEDIQSEQGPDFSELMKKIEETTPVDRLCPGFLSDQLSRTTLSQPWSEQDSPQLAEWIKGHDHTIATLLKISRMELCRFPISANLATTDFDYHSNMKSLAGILIRSSNYDLSKNLIDSALDKIECVLIMADHLYQHPSEISLLVAIAIEKIVIRQLNTIVVSQELSELQLGKVDNLVSSTRFNWKSNWPIITDIEKLKMKNLFAMEFQVNSAGKTRFSRDPMAKMREMVHRPPPGYWQKKIVKASIMLRWLCAPTTPQQISEIIDESYGDIYEMASPDFDWQDQPESFSFKDIKLNYFTTIQMLLRISKPVVYQIHDMYIESNSRKTGALLMIDLRHYKNSQNRWPESLNEIKTEDNTNLFIDPVNNDSFVYKLTDDSFTLYSKGENGIDDNGTRDDETSTDDIMFWPIDYSKACK